MTKLLHERLRKCDSWMDIDKMLGLEDSLFWTDTFQAFADEIERDYIPRTEHEAEVKRIIEAQGDRHKRPSKVLDADGVACEVGQTVWRISDGKRGEVVEVDTSDCPVWVDFGDYDYVWCKPDELTHESPVFDADGVRICKGDTVWHITRGEKHTVEHVDGEDGGIFIEGCNSIFSGVELTHREPDSLEKAIKDLGWLINYPMSDDEKLDKVDDIWRRLTALVERGA